jgi:hypothetical protein
VALVLERWRSPRYRRIRTAVGPALRLVRRTRRYWDLQPWSEFSDEEFIRFAYLFLLEREPDNDGLKVYREHLRKGRRGRHSLLAEMRGSDEFWFERAMHYRDPLIAIHRSRCLFVQSLPRAAQILDLGGLHQSAIEGALVHLGYPYDFDRLVVVDLPEEDRHELYRDPVLPRSLMTDKGPLEYHFRSMTDLSAFSDESFDLVYSGQSIEHVSVADADLVFAEVRRVLRPGAYFCLDTPSGAACRLQLLRTHRSVTNPDHKIEYTDAQLRRKVEAAGFKVVSAKGLNYIPRSFKHGWLIDRELAASTGIFDAIDDCYILAYVCTKER